MGGHGRPAIPTNHPPRTLFSRRPRTSVPTCTHTSVISVESSLMNLFQSRIVKSSPFQHRPCRRVRHTNVFASIASTNLSEHSLTQSPNNAMCSGLGATGKSALRDPASLRNRRTRFNIRCGPRCVMIAVSRRRERLWPSFSRVFSSRSSTEEFT